MASGIDWFRWHHGSVTDPKFALVARKAKTSLPDVLAVWAYLLEAASASENRGTFGHIDVEAVDFLFGFPDGPSRTGDILRAMVERQLIGAYDITNWDKRQSKRERLDDDSADRSRRYRERKAQSEDVTPRHAASHHVTPRHVTTCDDTPRHATERPEERREEKKRKQTPNLPLS